MSAILGALFAILIGIIAIIPYLNYQTQALETMRASNTASQFRQIINATRLYVQDNYGTLACTGATSCSISLTALEPNYLPNALSAMTPYNQTWQIQYIFNNGILQVLVFSSGGPNIAAPTTAMIAAETGQEAGIIPYPGQANTSAQVNLPAACDPTKHANANYTSYQAEAIGSYGHWLLPSLSSYAGPFCPGHLAALLYFGPNGTLEDDYLYRVAVPGQPNLNTMQTNLTLDSQNAGGSIGVQTNSQNQEDTTNTESSNTGSSSTISSLSNTNNQNNQVVTATNSSQSSAVVSAATSLGNNQIAMAATNSQSNALVSATGSGGNNQISMTATNSQASLAVQGTSSSAKYLAFISTQETPGTSCLATQIGNIAPDSDNSGTPLACITTSPYGAASWQKMIGFTSTSAPPPPQGGETYSSNVTNFAGGPEFVDATCPLIPSAFQDNVEILISSSNNAPLSTVSGLGFVSAMIPSGDSFRIATNPQYLIYECSILTTQ